MLAANRDINDLTPETAVLCRSFIAAAKRSGLDVFVTETRRSFDRQLALYALGRSQPGRIVSYSKAGTGKHEFGLAFDVAFHGDELYPKDTKKWARLGSIGESFGLTWGGRWKGVDSVHFENNRKVVFMGDNNDDDAVVTAKVAVVAAVTEKKTVTVTDIAKWAGVVTLAVPVLSIVFPQWAIIFKALGAFASAIGG